MNSAKSLLPLLLPMAISNYFFGHELRLVDLLCYIGLWLFFEYQKKPEDRKADVSTFSLLLVSVLSLHYYGLVVFFGSFIGWSTVLYLVEKHGFLRRDISKIADSAEEMFASGWKCDVERIIDFRRGEQYAACLVQVRGISEPILRLHRGACFKDPTQEEFDHMEKHMSALGRIDEDMILSYLKV